jgi:arylsulfatase A-like enzyme
MSTSRRFKFLSACVLFILTLVSTGRLTASPPTPNVLLITSEDNGPELGCYGDQFARTPHLDRLAAQGVRFKCAFVATASCSESRAALLTGLYPPIYFPQRTVRDGRYKLIVNLLQDRANPVAEVCSQMDRPPRPPYVTARDVAAATDHVKQAYATWRDAPPLELYDLQTDPHEWRNRADDPALADVKTRLLSELRRWQKRTDDPLADRAKLAKLTAEHDAIEKLYRRPKDSRWKYTDYLAPQNDKRNP